MLQTVVVQLIQPIKLSKLLYEIYFWQATVQDCGAKRLGFKGELLAVIISMKTLKLNKSCQFLFTAIKI
jgi:hypothetical protein